MSNTTAPEPQRWKQVDKIIDDDQSGLRLKITLTHGINWDGRNKDGMDAPVTWGNIAILPNDGESVSDMIDRIGAQHAYTTYAAQRGQPAADDHIKKHGMGIGVLISTQSNADHRQNNPAYTALDAQRDHDLWLEAKVLRDEGRPDAYDERTDKHMPQNILEELALRLTDMPNDKGLSQGSWNSIKSFLDTTMTPDELTLAQTTYDRTGGRSGTKPTR